MMPKSKPTVTTPFPPSLLTLNIHTSNKVHSKQPSFKDAYARSLHSTFISTAKLPYWGWHSVRFQSQIFKACLYHCKIQEMLHPRNWCLCRWNSSIVTISVKWQQCSPDLCLRDDILLNSISFLIIFSCSIHHPSLCSSLVLYAQNIFLASHPSFISYLFHPTCDSVSRDYLCLCEMCYVTGSSNM